MEYNNPLGQLVSTHPAFRELAEYVWQEHLKRRPEIDKRLAEEKQERARQGLKY